MSSSREPNTSTPLLNTASGSYGAVGGSKEFTLSSSQESSENSEEVEVLTRIKNDFFNNGAIVPLVNKIKQYINEEKHDKLSAFIASKETDDCKKIRILAEENPPVTASTLEQDLEMGTILLQKENNNAIAYWKKNNGKIEIQRLFVDKVDNIISFNSNEEITKESDEETFSKLKSMFGTPLFSALTQANKNSVEDIIDCYVKKHKIQYLNLMAHNILAYIGEGFYLYWDRESRIKTTSILPGMDKPLSSKTTLTGNELFNNVATAPITVANFTFDPNTEVRNYFQSIIEDPNNALSGVLKKHPVLASMFVLFAFGGGYVDVVDIQDWLQDKMGTLGKLGASTLLVYAAIIYYTVYNFNDVIQLYSKWMNSDSLLLNVGREIRKGNFEEAATNFVVGMHEFLTLIERVFRMSYGGYEAGAQSFNELLGYILGTAVGIGTIPVAVATRCMATRSFYDLSGIPRHVVAQAVQQFNERFSSTFPRKIWREMNLIIDPALFLETAITWIAYDRTADTTNNRATASVMATLTALVMHLIYRNASKKKMIVQSAKALLEEESKAISGAQQKPKTNMAGKIVSLTATIFDQGSRVVTFGYSTAAIAIFSTLLGTFALPKEELHGDEPTVNYKNLALLLLLESYIAVSAFRYQLGKTRGAITNFLPRFFAKKKPAAPFPALLSSSSNAASLDDSLLGNGYEEDEKKNPAPGFFNRNLEAVTTHDYQPVSSESSINTAPDRSRRFPCTIL